MPTPEQIHFIPPEAGRKEPVDLEARLFVQAQLALSKKLKSKETKDDRMLGWMTKNADTFKRLWDTDQDFRDFVMQHWQDQDGAWLIPAIQMWKRFKKEQSCAQDSAVQPPSTPNPPKPQAVPKERPVSW